MISLKDRLSSKDALLAPGVYDALSALLVEQAGFEAAYVSGASVSYTQVGRSDLGFVSATQIADVIARQRDRVSLPLLVDADTGFGNALNVQHTIRMFERAGANAIQLEDQKMPKRCGHLAGKELVSANEMAGKIRAATDARVSEETLIIARTDGIAVEGFEAALDRAELYVEAGADILFVEAPENAEQQKAIAERFKGRVPLLANMVEGGKTPVSGAQDLEDMGYGLVIVPGALVRGFAHYAQEFLAHLKENGSTLAFRDRMMDFKGVNKALGLPELVETAEKYADHQQTAEK